MNIENVYRNEKEEVFVDGEPAKLYRTDTEKPLVFGGIDYLTKKDTLWYVVPRDFKISSLKIKEK